MFTVYKKRGWCQLSVLDRSSLPLVGDCNLFPLKNSHHLDCNDASGFISGALNNDKHGKTNGTGIPEYTVKIFKLTRQPT